MRIKKNLKLITIVPILLLVLSSLYLLYQAFDSYHDNNPLRTAMQDAKQRTSLHTNLLRERGLSILFTYDKATQSKKMLNQQRSHTDQAVTGIEAMKKDGLQDTLASLLIARKGIDRFQLSYMAIFKTFDTIDDILMQNITNILHSPKNISIHRLIDTYIKTLKYMKTLSFERDMLLVYLTDNAPGQSLLLNHFFDDSSLKPHFDYLTQAQKKSLQTYLGSSHYQNALQDTDKLKMQLQEDMQSTFSSNTWFAGETQQIVSYNHVSHALLDMIEAQIAQQELWTILKALVGSFLLLLSLYMLRVYQRLYQYLFSSEKLERVLDKIIDYALIEGTLDLGSVEGVEKTYKIIEESVDNIALEQQKSQRDNAAKSIFLANMSHEIRTPINGILGFTELLKKSPLKEQEREYVEIIDQSTDNLLEIINNILDLSKIESKKMSLDESAFSPLEVFESTVDIYLSKMIEKEINLSLIMDSDFDHYLIGDWVKIKEVLLNLISNAHKFTPREGQISILIKKLPHSQKDVEKIYFEVSDSGIGIGKEAVEDIFDAFAQADSTITRKFGGTGLGLTISYNYISLMGSTLEVKSTEGIGSNFFFTLELTKGKAIARSERNRFHTMQVTLLKSTNTLLTETIENYMHYLGVKVRLMSFENFQQLPNLKPNLIIAQYEALKKDDFAYLQKHHTPTLMLFNTRFHAKMSQFQTETIFPVYEPLTLSKLSKVLVKIAQKQQLSILPQVNDTQKVISKKSNQIKRKILIAEDNAINQKLLVTILENFGLLVTSTANGQEAVKAFKEEPYDLIFMDIAMPIMDGVKATQAIRTYEEKRTLEPTPIVAMTANALKGDRERFLNDGLDDYIAKPAKHDTIQAILEKYAITIKHTIKHTTIQHPKSDTPIETDSKSMKPTHNILIFKKSAVESKIFEAVLSKGYHDIKTVSNVEAFYEALNQATFRVIMIDYEIEGLDFRVMLESIPSRDKSSLLLFKGFDSQVDDAIRREFDQILLNSADPSYLKSILDNYL